MVSELATNSVVHARSDFEVAIERTDTAVRVEVTDHGDGEPAPKPAHPTDIHGRGLLIVSTLADEWGVEDASPGRGKTVWFTVALASTSRLGRSSATG